MTTNWPSAPEGTALTEAEMAEMLASRDYTEAAEIRESGAAEATAQPARWQDVISQRGYDFCVRWETGGKAYYEQVIKGRPIWPGYASGITIGCGYDLGYHALNEFRDDWGTRIGRADFQRLAGTIGFKTVSPDRAQKVVKAQLLVASLADITIPWTLAIEQFDTSKMPLLVASLYRALDNLDKVHPHCRGALLSLAFNRGAGGYRSNGDRYLEMREIARLIRDGDYRRIPAQFRAMRRHWDAGSSLVKRREEEAALFESGLMEESVVVWQPERITAGQPEAAGTLREDHEDVAEATDLGDDEGMPESAPGFEFGLEVAGRSLADVRWNPNDDEQPDYRHLPKRSRSGAFELVAEDIETLINLNDFAVQPGLVVFALRGATLVGADKRENATSLILEDIRPDHRAFRCVMGVLNRQTRRLWAYRASTVPNAAAVLRCYRLAQAGQSLEGNVLPTGCYTYTVGTHKSGEPGEIRGVLRLSKEATGASVVVVLRSLSDTVYDRRDFWDKCAPADNIHPGRSSTGFSSLGCLTLPGDYDRSTRVHSGLWADFREALGMGHTFASSDDGRQYSCILLTGRDAALAADVRETGESSSAALTELARLRFGSKGAAVARLQQRLGLEPDNSQLFGPITRMALIARQERKLGWADGMFSAEMEPLLFGA